MVGLVFGASASNSARAPTTTSPTRPRSRRTRARRSKRATGADPTAGVLALVAAPAGSAQGARARRCCAAIAAVARVRGPIASASGASALLAATLRAGVDEHDAGRTRESAVRGRRARSLGGATIAGPRGRRPGLQGPRPGGGARLPADRAARVPDLPRRGGAAAAWRSAATSVFAAFALLRAVNVALPLSVFALNLVIGLGLGLAVDYSLFLVSRFREELGAGRTPRAAVLTTMTHGRPDRRLQRGHGGDRDVLAGRVPAALPAVDGDRRGDHRADRGGRRADAAAGAVRAVRRPPRPHAARARRARAAGTRSRTRVLRHPGLVALAAPRRR